MKKLLVSSLFFLVTGTAFALPVGNPADPILLNNGIFWDTCWDNCYDNSFDSCNPCDSCGFDWDFFSLRFGYYGDFVFNRKLETRNGTFEDNRIDHTRISTNAGLIVLNLWERLDIFTTLGGTKLFHEHDSFLTPALGRVEVETDSHFSWSVGGRLVLLDWNCTYIGVEGQYFSVTPHIRRVTIDSTTSIYPDNKSHYREWQVGLGIAQRINMFVPYFAFKWSNSRFRSEDVTVIDLPNFKPRTQWGYAFGVSLVDCDIMSLNVEGRLRDEKAVAVNAQIRL